MYLKYHSHKYYVTIMDTCVICLGSFSKAREPAYCQFCFRAIGHAKCVSSLVSVMQKKCPRCNKGRVLKPETRLQCKDRKWSYLLSILVQSEYLEDYIITATNLVEKTLRVKNLHYMESPYLLLELLQVVQEVSEPYFEPTPPEFYLRFVLTLQKFEMLL